MERVAFRAIVQCPRTLIFLGSAAIRPQNSHRVIAAPESVMELLAGILPLAPLPVEISIQPRYFKSTSFGFLFYVVCGTKRKRLETMLQLLKEHWCLGRSTSWQSQQSQQSPHTNLDSQNSRQLQLGSPKGGIRTSTCKRSIRMRSLWMSDVWTREFHARPPGVSPPNSGRRRCLKTKPSQVAIRASQVLRSHQVHLPSSKAFITEEHFGNVLLMYIMYIQLIFNCHILFCLVSKLPTNRKLKLLQLFLPVLPMLLPLHLVTRTLPCGDISVYRSALSPAHRSRSTWPMAIASRCGCGMQAPQTATMSCGNTCLLLWFVYLLSVCTIICRAALIFVFFFRHVLVSATIPQNKNNRCSPPPFAQQSQLHRRDLPSPMDYSLPVTHVTL